MKPETRQVLYVASRYMATVKACLHGQDTTREAEALEVAKVASELLRGAFELEDVGSDVKRQRLATALITAAENYLDDSPEYQADYEEHP